jgi:hypothetical protein
MWNSITATPHRPVVSGVAALILAVALPQAGVAMSMSEAGLWKVTRSTIGPYTGKMVLERVRKGEAVTSEGTFLVISRGKAYLATPMTASSGADGKTLVDYQAWGGMKLEHIGTRVRAINDCGALCQHGFLGDRMTVTFRTVKKPPKPADSFVALDKVEE